MKTSLELEQHRKIQVDKNASEPFDIISSHLDALGAQERHELGLLTTPDALFGGFETQNVVLLMMLKDFYEKAPSLRSSFSSSSSLSSVSSSDAETKAAYDQPESSPPSSRMSSEVENEVLPSSPEEEDSSLRGPRPEISDVSSSLEGSSCLADAVQEVQSSDQESDKNQNDELEETEEDLTLRGPRPEAPIIENRPCSDLSLKSSRIILMSVIFFLALHSPTS